MFKQIGQIASMMKNLPKMRAAMEELQQKLGAVTHRRQLPAAAWSRPRSTAAWK